MDVRESAGSLRPAEPTSTGAPRRGLLPTTRRGRWLVLGILALAFLLRAAVVLAWTDFEPTTDALHFDHIATSLASGEGYGEAIVPPAGGPSAFRTPVYPTTLAAVYTVFGEQDWVAARMANAAVGTLLVALIGLIGAQLWSRRVGGVAMALAATHPAMLLTGSSLVLEPTLVVLSLGALAAALQHLRAPRGLRWPLAAGILIGLAVLTREQAAMLIPPLAWMIWEHERKQRPAASSSDHRRHPRPLMAGAVMLVTAVVIVLPWTARNAIVMDAFVPVSTSSGIGLAGTYNETSRSSEENPALWIAPWEDPGMREIMTSDPDMTEVGADRELRGAAIRFLLDHPGYPVRVAFHNTLRMFDLDGGEYSLTIARHVPYPQPLTLLAILGGYGTLAVSLLAVALAPTRRALRSVPRAVWAIPFSLYVFMVVALPGSIRYRASLEPFLVLAASLVLVAGFDRLRRRRALTDESPAAT